MDQGGYNLNKGRCISDLGGYIRGQGGYNWNKGGYIRDLGGQNRDQGWYKKGIKVDIKKGSKLI